MKPLFLIFLVFFSSGSMLAQKNIDELLEQYNTRSVPYISVQELKMDETKYTILDTRKKQEFMVSHLPNAIWVGEQPNDSILNTLPILKSKPIVVYCSVGIRSETYGEKLNSKGYTNVQNLYGSIFAWKDAGFTVVDSLNQYTDKVHVFSKVWGKYLKTGDKVY
jgi:rhodanese-related sulfurtransferase